jgi:hypothetical protein
MPGTAGTANLRSGTLAPATGIYVVAHYQPSHAPPHEVVITGGTPLPECQKCADVRFSLKAYAPQPWEENEFFRPRKA